MTLLSLAARNAWRRKRRYGPAVVNLAFFGVVFVLLAGIGDAIVANLQARAEVYYGGSVTLLTYRQGPGFWDDSSLDAEQVRQWTAGFDGVTGVGQRHVFRQPGTDLIAPAGAAALRLVAGLDPSLSLPWDLESGTSSLGPSDLLVPRSMARRLSLRPGQSVTLSLRTYSGQRNTVRLTVAGVYRDDPVFGRGVAYVDRRSLNLWSGKPETYGSEITMTVRGTMGSGRLVQLQTLLEQKTSLWPHPADKAAFLAWYPKQTWEGPRSVLLRLDDHVRSLNMALEALRWGLDAVALLLLVVSALGLGSTLKVLLHERIRELGTLRALGMDAGRVERLLLAEVCLVSGTAVAGGVAIGTVVLLFLSGTQLVEYSLIEPLLNSGSLGYHTSVLPAVAAFVWALGASIVVARPLIRRQLRSAPAVALSEGTS